MDVSLIPHMEYHAREAREDHVQTLADFYIDTKCQDQTSEQRLKCREEIISACLNPTHGANTTAMYCKLLHESLDMALRNGALNKCKALAHYPYTPTLALSRIIDQHNADMPKLFHMRSLVIHLAAALGVRLDRRREMMPLSEHHSYRPS